MTMVSDREKAGREIYRAIGSFLFEHGLDPSPANYSLLHQLITGSNPAAVAAIEAATSEGIRLTQREADKIISAVGLGMALQESGAPAGLKQAMSDVRSQMARFADLVASTHAATRDYEQDLETSAGELMNGATSLAELIQITSSMLERTRAAESQLQAATGEAAALRERLENAQEEARRDPLTGIPNRRALEDYYEQLHQKGSPAVVVMCDLDRFKAINDNHGHAVGDRVLKTVAETLSVAFTGYIVARTGGEEFVAVLPGIQLEAAAEIVENARLTVAARRLRVRGTDAGLGMITFSAGIANANGEPLEEALRRADALLYRAKAEGRDRVIVEEAS